MFFLSKCAFFVVLLAFSFGLTTAAGENPAEFTEETTLPAVVVLGTAAKSQETGLSTLSGEDLGNLPLGSDSISESVKILPGVQLSEDERSSLRGGEILPPEISISGGGPFQNNFSIDGLSNNSFLDPESRDSGPNSGTFIPDHSQDVFLDPALVGAVNLYRSNVPAKFGDFSGGVVDARTRNPDSEFWGKVDLKTTRDEWTTFHLLDEDRQDFENSDSFSEQPDFNIYDAGVTLNIPTGKDSGVLASYRQRRSRIPLKFLSDTRKQSRKLENFFLKWHSDLSPRDTLSATIAHTPYEEELFYPHSRHSDYTIEGGGTMVALTYERLLPIGDLQIKGGYRLKDNERSAPPHLFIWNVSPSKPWGEQIGSSTSREGMVGSIEMSQDVYQFKTDLQVVPLHSGPLTHELEAGIDLERAEGRYRRPDDTFQFYSAQTDPDVDCAPDDIGCIEGEQYFGGRIIFPSGRAETSIDYLRLYLEDLISFDRFQIRPGLRFSYNDFQKNANLGPRLLTRFDLFDDDRTVFFAGLNRYYGKVFLSYALREGINPNIFQSRNLEANNQPGTWDSFLQGSAYRYSELKTPYTDEISAGVTQKLFGGTGELHYLHRKRQDGYARQKGDREEDGIRYYSLNNNGSSSHEEYGLSWEKQAGRQSVHLNVTYQETTSSNIDYDEQFDLEDLNTLTWFKGEVINKEELPREDYNRPWIANLFYSVLLPKGFEFTNLTTWRAGYEGLDRVFPLPTDAPASVTEAYEVVDKPSSWIFDWKLAWHRKIDHIGGLTLNLEVLNVFNEKTAVGSKENEFEMGRQFWAGAEYLF